MKRNIIWSPFQFDFQKANKTESMSEYERLEMERDGIDKLMETPFGIFKIDDSMNPFKSFDFWMGHTTFKIDLEVFQTINTTLGVESFNVLSPYRFIISVGQAFEWRDVRCQLEHDLCGKHVAMSLIKTIENIDIRDSAQKVYDDLKKEKYWFMYVFPNGNIVNNKFQKLNNYQEEVKLYKQAKLISNGLLISSEDEDGNK